MAATTRVTLVVLGLLGLNLTDQLPASAQDVPTATVHIETTQSDRHLPPPRLVYTAGDSQANEVEIAADPSGADGVPGPWIISETGSTNTGQAIVLIAGAGCTSIDSQTARCDPTLDDDMLNIEAFLKDENDSGMLREACGDQASSAAFTCLAVARGGQGHDVLYATDVEESHFYGDRGADTMTAGDAGSLLDGGSGEDHIIGSDSGADHLRGSFGNDTIAGRGGNDRIVGGSGRDSITGGTGADVIDGAGFGDVLVGGAGNDTIIGGLGRDRLRGTEGNDTIVARDGLADVVRGGSGTDRGRLDRSDDTTSVERRF